MVVLYRCLPFSSLFSTTHKSRTSGVDAERQDRLPCRDSQRSLHQKGRANHLNVCTTQVPRDVFSGARSPVTRVSHSWSEDRLRLCGVQNPGTSAHAPPLFQDDSLSPTRGAPKRNQGGLKDAGARVGVKDATPDSGAYGSPLTRVCHLQQEGPFVDSMMGPDAETSHLTNTCKTCMSNIETP